MDKNLATSTYEWQNDVTGASSTPEGYRYVGASNHSIVQDLANSQTYSTEPNTQLSSLSSSTFDNKYSAKGYAVNHITTKSKMQVGLQANVTESYNSETGALEGKTFNGLDVSATVTGDIYGAYPGIDLSLSFKSMTLNGEAMTASNFETPTFLPGGDVPTLSFDSFISAETISSGSELNFNVSFKGLYADPKDGVFAKLPTVLGNVTGFGNTTNLRVSFDLNNQ